MTARDDLVWSYGGLEVVYREELDGRGSTLAPAFATFVAERTIAPYRCAFEWCAGPGFIGFALLADGLCDHLCLADVNPAAVDCVRRTIERNGLHDRVHVRLGDNLAALPRDARFDLVVGNPPSFHALNPDHPRYARFRDDLRPNDRGWEVHRGFYRDIHRHLLPGAVLHISEVDPDHAEVFVPRDEPIPYDVRPCPAGEDFRAMIAEGGLRYVDTNHYFTDSDGAELAIMTSTL
jgi:hypothetical protein